MVYCLKYINIIAIVIVIAFVTVIVMVVFIVALIIIIQIIINIIINIFIIFINITNMIIILYFVRLDFGCALFKCRISDIDENYQASF